MKRTPCALGTGLPLSEIPKGRSPLVARRVNALRCEITLRKRTAFTTIIEFDKELNIIVKRHEVRCNEKDTAPLEKHNGDPLRVFTEL